MKTNQDFFTLNKTQVEQYIKVHKLGEEWNAKQREKRQMGAQGLIDEVKK